jgi:capsular exopolysaccharide synthesis family protein
MSKIFAALTEAAKLKSGADTEPQPHVSKAEKKTNAGPIDHLTGSATAEYMLLRERIVRLTPNLNQRALLFASPSDDRWSLDVVTNFCLTLAGGGEKVLLVGIGMDESFMCRLFGINQFPGISEIFSGQSAIQELIRQTIYSNLFFLPGKPLPNPLSPEEHCILRDATGDMKSVADWIIFSCPPVSLLDDAATLAAMVDGVILVIKAAKTTRGAARIARESLKKAGANILGVVLNDRKNFIPDWINRWL